MFASISSLFTAPSKTPPNNNPPNTENITPNVYVRTKKPVLSSQIPAPAAPLPEFMDVEEVLERMKEIGAKYPDLSGTFSEMQEKHMKRTQLRKDTPGALSNAKKKVEVYQSRMDELNALAPN
jgi:hypothetical protein